MPESPVVEVSPTKMNDIEITIATNLPDDSKDVEKEVVSEPPAFKHTWSVWSIFLVLCLFSFLSGLDGTIVTTSLPTIIREIGGGEQLYLWTAQSFFFSSTAPQLSSDKSPIGLSGGATSAAMLIVGRIVQGLGAGGLYVLSDIIICDIVPPRHRGPYLSVVVSTAGIGATIGPVVGGALADSNWRWVFYLNLPISILGFIVMILLLKVKHKRNPTWLYALKRVDFLGAFIFIPSMISLFLGLITGGIQQPWSSWRTILPLILGVFGWLLYHFHQATPSLCPFPSTPPRLFTNRTSVIGFLLIFLSSIILQSIAYFLPLYFQAVKLVSPLLSGVYYLPFALAIIPFAGSAGFLLSKYGRYIPLHYCGFALLVLGSGLLSTLTVQSSRAAWIGFQIIPSAGIALVFTATMPSTLVALEEADVAVATATYSFVRSFGFVWGVTIAGVVFNGQVDTYLYLVKDEGVRGLLRGGAAYAFAASGEGIKGLADESTKGQVIEVYARALRVIWLVVMTIALVGLLCIPVERRIDLRKSHVTEFGLEEEN